MAVLFGPLVGQFAGAECADSTIRRNDVPMTRKQFTPYVLILPSLAVMGIIYVFPLFYGIYMSLHEYYLIKIEHPFVGLSNFVALFRDSLYWKAFNHTMVWAVVCTSSSMGLAFLSAILLNQKFRGRNVVRTLVLVPWFVPMAAGAMLWAMLYQPNYGIIDYFMSGILRIRYLRSWSWLGNPATALLAVIMVRVWKVFPFYGLMLLAGLELIPENLYEVASIDGAGSFRKFISITFPCLKSVFVVVLLINLIWTFQSFQYVYILTGGGPARSTEILGTLAYSNAFSYLRFGYASAIAVTMLMLVLLISAIYLKIVKFQ